MPLESEMSALESAQANFELKAESSSRFRPQADAEHLPSNISSTSSVSSLCGPRLGDSSETSRVCFAGPLARYTLVFEGVPRMTSIRLYDEPLHTSVQNHCFPFYPLILRDPLFEYGVVAGKLPARTQAETIMARDIFYDGRLCVRKQYGTTYLPS